MNQNWKPDILVFQTKSGENNFEHIFSTFKSHLEAVAPNLFFWKMKNGYNDLSATWREKKNHTKTYQIQILTTPFTEKRLEKFHSGHKIRK